MGIFSPAQRLIVSLDFKPVRNLGHGKEWARSQIFRLLRQLEDTGIYIKLNSALRAYGYELIDEVHSHGLAVFADSKLFDISETLSMDGALLNQYRPELLTVFCSAGVNAIKSLKTELPDTEILGVTVLTNMTEDDVGEIFHNTTEGTVSKFAQLGDSAGVDGFICSPHEVPIIRGLVGRKVTINTPNIRPRWTFVENDGQNPNRSMTPYQAIKTGSDRIIVGRPIVQALNPYDAVMRTIEEIESALL